jgi:hypothetical protein
LEAHAFRGAARLEEGGDKDPDNEVRYDGDTSDDAVSETSGLDLSLPVATNVPDLNFIPPATSDQELSLTSATGALMFATSARSSATSGKEEAEQQRTAGLSRMTEWRATLLNRSRVLRGEDILRLVKTKDVRVTGDNIACCRNSG